MRKSVWLLSSALLALSFRADAASAQETDTDKDSAEPTQGATAEAAAVDASAVEADRVNVGGEIIVTATRRNQALSDVPIAVSAVTGAQLQASGATDIRQLNQL
ncbi:MAG: hypothetical protein M3177_11500, partial [Pseudomonadota bacterium]|nr:hypothetical protein [Pseudomonadota bacterium]